MTEIETTLPGRRITAGPTELYIEDTEWPGRRIRTKLRGDDAKKVAEALDPGRGTYPSGSHADEMARAIDRLTADRDEANARADRAEDRFAALRADAATLGVHLGDPGSAHTRILEQNDEIKDLKANLAQAEAQLATLKVAARLAGVVMHSDWNTAAPTENKPPAPHPEEAAVDAFKAAWHKADSEGDDGNRVRRGLRAALQSIEEASENE